MKRVFAFVLMLVLLFSVKGMSEGTVYQYGDQGEEVVSIQEKLAELGYYTGKISGNYLEGTRAGIKKFQKDNGLEVTGIADEATLALLTEAEYRILQSGDDGDDVKRLQQELIDLGYLEAKATGKFRQATKNAVESFQAANRLDPTGIADFETQKLLFSGNPVPKGGKATPTPSPEEDLGDINDMVLAGDGEAVEEVYLKKLKRGAKGENVKKVQTRLTELGYFDGPISGNYMNQTMEAVKAFQKNNGMEETGITDEATWNCLFNSADTVDAASTPRPTPEPTPIPYAITVDVRNQVVIVYGRDENGEYTDPVKWFICSTGMKATPSDVGEWVLNGRKARWCYFGKWNSHAQYWTRINENIAFHSLIYNSVDYNALSVKSYNKLGHRASHGCVRLLVSDSKWIYENIGEGTVVTITESLPSDEELRKAVAKPPLNSAKTGPVKTPVPTATPNYISGAMPPQPFRALKKGMEGEDVFWLQKKLTELGFYSGAVTGGFYSGTEKAVKAFQKANKLSQSGVADEKTLNVLYAEELAANATPIPSPDITPAPTVSPEQ